MKPDKLLKRVAYIAEYYNSTHIVVVSIFICIFLYIAASFVHDRYELKGAKWEEAKIREFTSGANEIEVRPSILDSFSSTTPTSQPPSQTPSVNRQVEPTIAQNYGQNEIRNTPTQQENAKRLEDDRVFGSIMVLENNLDDLINASATFERRIALLLDNEEGRRIASDPTLLEQCIDVIVGQSSAKASIVSFQDDLSVCKKTIATTRLTSNDLAGAFASISSLSGKVERLQKEFDIARRTLDRWIANSSANRPSDKTLQEIIDERESERFVRMSRESRLRIDAEKDKLEAVKSNIEIAKVQTEEKKRRDELDLLMGQENIRIAEQNKQLAILKLQQDFQNDWLEIQSLLAPFISEGSSKFVHFSGDTYYVEQTGRRELLSISTIQSSGALNDSDAGFDRLLYIATHEFNKRNKGSFPVVDKISIKRDPRVKLTMRRAQELLSKYGDLLVEQGLLSK